MLAKMLGLMGLSPKDLLTLIPPAKRRQMLNKVGGLLRDYARDYADQVPPGGDVRGSIFYLEKDGQLGTFVKFEVTWKDTSGQCDRMSKQLLNEIGEPLVAPLDVVAEKLLLLISSGQLDLTGLAADLDVGALPEPRQLGTGDSPTIGL